MKPAETKLYTDPATYFQGPDGMRNEVAMWFVASGLLMQQISIRLGNKPFGGLGSSIGATIEKPQEPITVLDACSGPGNFVNHLAFVYPNLKVTGVDSNNEFTQAGQRLFEKLGWQFLHQDMVSVHLKTKFDFVTCSSAYHHIEDERKATFLRNLRKHLKNDGRIIVCENFLPPYSSNAERDQSIEMYYQSLIDYYHQGNATAASIEAIKEVRELERSGIEEHKVSYDIFCKHLQESNLEIEQEVIVWQPSPDTTAGSRVLVLKPKGL